MRRDEVEVMVAAALAEAERGGVTGAAVTPYLLSALDRLSGGRTRKVNFALAVSNATVGGQLSVALAEIEKERGRD